MAESNLPAARQVSTVRWTEGDAYAELSRSRVPDVVDINVIGLCQLRCAFCWGPEHDQRAVDIEMWAGVLAKLARDGTRRIVYTGGEPLLFGGLSELLRVGRGLGLKNTLSTNGVLLSRQARLLDNTDHVGIPLDGSCVEVQERMRPRSSTHQGWNRAVEAMRIVQGTGAVSLIIRTVVAKANLDDVPRIPAVLAEHGISLQGDRVLYKLYQVSRRGEIARNIPAQEWRDKWYVSPAEIERVAARIRDAFPGLMVATQPTTALDGRYFLVDPAGNVHRGEMGGPVAGNLFDDYEACLNAYGASQ